jgi:hypothetical protein
MYLLFLVVRHMSWLQNQNCSIKTVKCVFSVQALALFEFPACYLQFMEEAGHNKKDRLRETLSRSFLL